MWNRGIFTFEYFLSFPTVLIQEQIWRGQKKEILNLRRVTSPSVKVIWRQKLKIFLILKYKISFDRTVSELILNISRKFLPESLLNNLINKNLKK